MQITLPRHPSPDRIIWKNSNNGELSLKDAYFFKMPHAQHIKWAKSIWSIDISPSKSLMAWRLMHNNSPLMITYVQFIFPL